MAIPFIDLSHYQATVDLAAYAAAGYDRVFLKATQGTGYTDPTFADRWQLAAELGLARGAYHFAEAGDSGAADFDHFIAVIEAAGGLGPRDLLCLDSEDTAATSRADEHAREFTGRAADRGYPDGCLYTGRWYAEPADLRPDDLVPGWRRLWISDYRTAVPDDQIVLPMGWTRDQVIARQYTSTATISGVAGLCDANRVLKEWTMSATGPEHWDAADERVIRALIDERLEGWLAALAQGQLNSTTGGDTGAARLLDLRRLLEGLPAAVVNQLPPGSSVPIDMAALAKAVNDDAARRLAS